MRQEHAVRCKIVSKERDTLGTRETTGQQTKCEVMTKLLKRRTVLKLLQRAFKHQAELQLTRAD